MFTRIFKAMIRGQERRATQEVVSRLQSLEYRGESEEYIRHLIEEGKIE